MDLINHHWPISIGNEKLCYYFGFWLPSALIGKLFGINVGYYSQFLFAFLGIILVCLLIFEYTQSIKLRTIFVFIFFSGLDSISFLINHSLVDLCYSIFNGNHIELLLTYFNSSSNTTLLFWLYNQTIPFWIGFLLILQIKNIKIIGFVYASMFIFSPFPTVALLPLIIFYIVGNYSNTGVGHLKANIQDAFSFENFISIPLVLIIALFFASNNSAKGLYLLPIKTNILLRFIVFFITEFLIYIVLLFNQLKRDATFYILLTTTIICSFIVMGDSYDFAWRTCIPLAFYLMLTLIRYLDNNFSLKSTPIFILCFILCIGFITPLSEIIRTVRHEYMVINHEESALSDSLSSIFIYENNECRNNFVSNDENIFFKYIAKE